MVVLSSSVIRRFGRRCCRNWRPALLDLRLRGAATVAFRGAAARFMAGMAMRTPIGIAGLAAVGGTYYLVTGENPLDALLEFVTDGARVKVPYDAGCAGMPKRSGAPQKDRKSVG